MDGRASQRTNNAPWVERTDQTRACEQIHYMYDTEANQPPTAAKKTTCIAMCIVLPQENQYNLHSVGRLGQDNMCIATRVVFKCRQHKHITKPGSLCEQHAKLLSGYWKLACCEANAFKATKISSSCSKSDICKHLHIWFDVDHQQPRALTTCYEPHTDHWINQFIITG